MFINVLLNNKILNAKNTRIITMRKNVKTNSINVSIVKANIKQRLTFFQNANINNKN